MNIYVVELLTQTVVVAENETEARAAACEWADIALSHSDIPEDNMNGRIVTHVLELEDDLGDGGGEDGDGEPLPVVETPKVGLVGKVLDFVRKAA